MHIFHVHFIFEKTDEYYGSIAAIYQNRTRQEIGVAYNTLRNVKWKEINDIIAQVRELRNRINHNEPICFVNRKCDFSYVKSMYAIISDFLTWIDPEIMPSLREVDKVCKIIEKEENKQKQ